MPEIFLFLVGLLTFLTSPSPSNQVICVSSSSSQGPNAWVEQIKGGEVLFALPYGSSSHLVPLLWALKEAEHGKKGRAEQSCSPPGSHWEAERERQRQQQRTRYTLQRHTTSDPLSPTTSHILAACPIFTYLCLNPLTESVSSRHNCLSTPD